MFDPFFTFFKKKNSLCAREMRLIRFLRVFIIAAEFKNEKKKAFELVLPKAHALSVDLSVTHVSGNFFFPKIRALWNLFVSERDGIKFVRSRN